MSSASDTAAADQASAQRLERTRSLGRTVPQEAFSASGLARHLAAQSPPDPSAGTVPLLERPGLSEQSTRHGLNLAGEGRSRFEVEGVLGIGATGRVYAVRDHNLERPVAVKFLIGEHAPGPDEVRRFIEEAQITASLEHPNVLPVHELDINEAGQVFFTMKKIDGGSLGAAIEQSTLASRARPIDGFSAIASVFIGVCQAAAYAHDRGVVHQDIKPDNIMLGDYGEVLLVDWGSAIRLRPGEKPRLYGTPLYMSPEQARLEGVDERSDVYCLGATLFHTLTLRLPIWSDQPERFWAMKRAGEIIAPTEAERAALPPALLDIALKALAADPAARYAGASAMLHDLQRFQAGLAVSAHRDSLLELLARWHRRHARAIWSSLAAVAVVVSLAAALYGERLKEMARWGPPLVDETFADDSWRTRWKPYEGGFERRDGRLVSVAPGSSILMYATRCEGDTAIEYDAEILPGTRPCDLSLFWVRDLVPSADGARVEKLVGLYRLQIGIFDGAYTAITRIEGKDQAQHLATNDFHPLPGVRYRVRAEIVDARMSLWVDGKLLCEWLDPLPFTGGYLGLYGFYPGKSFDNVRIFSRGVPEKVAATAIGDAFARQELPDQATVEYARVAASHQGTAIAREALYREGLCRYRQGRWSEAFRIWEALRGTDHDELVRLHELERTLAGDDHDRALADLEALYAAASPETRKRIAMAWAQAIERHREARQLDLVRRYLEVHDRVFADQHTVDNNAARALMALGRYHEVIDRYPRQRMLCGSAWLALGRQDIIAAEFPDQPNNYYLALLLTGQSERIDPDFIPAVYALGLYKRCRFDELLARYGTWTRHDVKEAVCCGLSFLGRFDEIMRITSADNPEDTWIRQRALLLQGKALETPGDGELALMIRLGRDEPEQALALSPSMQNDWTTWAHHAIGMRAWADGDRDRGRAEFTVASGMPTGHEPVFFFHQFVVPFLGCLDGHDFAALHAACAEIISTEVKRTFLEQRPWFEAMYLEGRLDDAGFLAISHRVYMDARLLVCRGMRHEIHGERAEALADYRASLAVPLWQRGLEVDPALNRFVAWRADQLAAADSR